MSALCAYAAPMLETIRWARTAGPGDYLIRWDDAWLAPDPGSRGGYSDPELSEIREVLARRDLRLSTDDLGIVVN